MPIRRTPQTVAEVVRWTSSTLSDAGVQQPRLDAELIVAHCLGLDRSVLPMTQQETLSDAQLQQVKRLVNRRQSREPIQYILGHWEFWSINLVVKEGALIPRPETETLVEAALGELEGSSGLAPSARPLILDIGTGSGAIAVALATELSGKCKIAATDISRAALAVAGANVSRMGLQHTVALVCCDMATALSPRASAQRVELIVCNPPYIRSEDLKGLQPEISQFEPAIALDGGASGLDFYPRLLETAASLLKEGGALICEIAPDMSLAIKNMQRTMRNSMDEPRFVVDLSGRKRVAVFHRLGRS